MKVGLFKENIRVALGSIRAQLLRAIITALIISFGIMALVGILTATDVIKQTITGQLASLGSNTFSIQNQQRTIYIGQRGARPKYNPPIKYQQAIDFKERMASSAGVVSLSFMASYLTEVKYQSLKTDPNTQVWAIDENYFATSGLEVELGRAFTPRDVEDGRPVVIIGQDIVNSLFKNKNPLGEIINLRGRNFLVVGVLKTKGSSSLFSGDRAVYIPISNARFTFSAPNRTYAINVMTANNIDLESAIGEATAVMRAVRKLKPKEEDSFAIVRSDSLASMVIENISAITGAALLIGIITLFSASISLMNIMLVSVTERTKEIGIRKALGANNKTILTQFLTEAIIITQIGGVFGIILGISMGNIISVLIGGSFIVPWFWIFISFVLCFIVGVVAGLYPANKAAKQDPIEALRFE